LGRKTCSKIINEMKEIQQQIDSFRLSEKSASDVPPFKVGQLLNLKKKCALIKLEFTVLHSANENFLSTGNEKGFNNLMNNCKQAFSLLKTHNDESLVMMSIKLPKSLIPDDSKAQKLYPWICLHSCNGPFTYCYKKYWADLSTIVKTCFASLSKSEAEFVNAEFLAVDLLLNEVLKQGVLPVLSIKDSINQMTLEIVETNVGESKTPKVALSKVNQPIVSYKLLLLFLQLSKQLSFCKYEWATHKLQTNDINSLELYRLFSTAYSKEILYPTYKSLTMKKHSYMFNTTSNNEMFPKPPLVPEFTIRASLLKRLLEQIELRMIEELRMQIAKDITSYMSLASKVEDTVLPLNLWSDSTSVYKPSENNKEGGISKESLVITQSTICEEFVQRLMSSSKLKVDDITKENVVFFSERHLKSCLNKLAQEIMTREKDSDESYSVFYTNLLQDHHRQLLIKEMCLKNAISTSKTSQNHFHLADKSHELILEVTALRSKNVQLKNEIISLQNKVRVEEKKKFQETVKDLWTYCFGIKEKLGDYHLLLHHDIKSLVSSTRKEAMVLLEKLRDETPSSTARERLFTIKNKEIQLDKLQEDNTELRRLINKMKAFSQVKLACSNIIFNKKIDRMNCVIDKTKHDCVSREMICHEDNRLLREQLKSARKELKNSHNVLDDTHKKIALIKKVAEEKKHQIQVENKTRENLFNANQRKMKRLVFELEEKDNRLKELTTTSNKNSMIYDTERNKIQKKIELLDVRLAKEESLKLKALKRVEELKSTFLLGECIKQPYLPERTRPKSSLAKVPNFKTRTMTFTSRPATSSSRKMSRVITDKNISKEKTTLKPILFHETRDNTVDNLINNRIAAYLMYPAANASDKS